VPADEPGRSREKNRMHRSAGPGPSALDPDADVRDCGESTPFVYAVAVASARGQ